MASVTRPPGPKGLPILGCLVDLRRRPLDFVLEGARYGDVAYARLPFVGGVYLLNRPEYIGRVLVDNANGFVKSADYAVLKQLLGEGLVTSEGELHKRQRRLIAPAFHRARISAYADIVTTYGLRMCERWQPGATLDIHTEMTQVTLAIVSKALLNADVDSAEASVVSDAVTTLMPLIDNPILILSPKLFRWLPGHKSHVSALERLDSTVYRMVAEHRRTGGDRGDLLSMLLAARDEEDAGRRMSDQQVRDEVMTIFLAGHETTANALTWTLYLLSQNPEAEARLHDELDAVLGGRRPTVEDLPRLPYTAMVLNESLRMYPPVWAIGRRALRDFELGGWVIPAGSNIALSQWAMHHDARYYPNPWVFRPERWLPREQDARPEFAFFPFGGGPRICIGESFARMETALLIAAIAQNWRLRLQPGFSVELSALVTLRPKSGLRMTLEPRARKEGTMRALPPESPPPPPLVA
jgi:cytochrome P450